MAKTELRCFIPKPEEIEHRWYHVDANGQTLGRLATRIATVLMGKHKPTYVAHLDSGDFVIVTNAHQIRVTGRKRETMKYSRYSYYPGGYREIPFKAMMEKFPERVLTAAVRRMLPKSTLGRHMLGKLKVYAAADHPHQAQRPDPFPI